MKSWSARVNSVDYTFDVLIPADTPAVTPYEVIAKIGVGVITEVSIEIPRGCKGMVYASVRQGVHQVYPLNPEGAYRSDGRVYRARDHRVVMRGDPLLIMQGWSPDTTYEHNVQIRFIVLPLEIAEPWRKQETIMDLLLKGLGLKKTVKKG